MEMEDEDEFGDLYTDVLRPIEAAPLPHPPIISSTNPSADPFVDDDDDDDDYRISSKPSRSDLPLRSISDPPRILAPIADEDEKDDWLLGRTPAAVDPPANWNEDEEEEVAVRSSEIPVADSAEELEPRVLEEEEGEEEAAARVSGSLDDGTKVAEDKRFRFAEEDADAFLGEGAVEKLEIDDMDQEPVIPGLSSAPITPGPLQALNGGDVKASATDDWDSDSEDDLQIVLNDNNHGRLGGERHDGVGSEDDDEDGEEDLVIVTDEDQHHHHQSMEEQDWGEEALQPTADGERKEISEAAKVNGAIGNAAGPRIGYSNHVFHPQHHSMYKYIRPGVAPVSGAPVVGAVGPPGQIRPPTLGPIAGRGRGDWRPLGGRGISNAQKNFHSGYGAPAWANTSGRGLDFTLPSHKTVFDVDIESFDEKPWRHPGVDISDFFNFGLDEDSWKDYCKQLDQLRLESTMQSKIRVYESGRSEQDYDPDLPPELAAAAGHHDISANNMHHAKADNGQADLNDQGRGAPCIRAPLPTGRAIQVEGGYGERLPSIDTRPPRIRDSDAIIEIVLQGSMDDSTICNGGLEQSERDTQAEQLKGVHNVEDERRVESEYYDQIPHNTFNGRKREIVTRRVPCAPEGDGILPFPSESPLQYHPNSRLRSPLNPGGSFGTHRGGRSTQGSSRGRSGGTNAEHDDIPNRSAQVNKHDARQKEKPGESAEGNQTPEAMAVEAARELSIEQKDGERDDRLALGDSVEGEETSDFRISTETLGDDSLVHSSKKQKLSSRVEQTPIQDKVEDDDLRATHSDNSRARSGSSKDHQKRRESGDEVVQEGRSRRMSELRRHHEEEQTFRRKDDYGRDGRHEMDRNQMGSKGRDVMYHSYPRRDWETNSAHTVRGRSEGFERPREADGSIWQRREDDIHSRRVKDENIRRERNEEAGSRSRSKARVSDKNDKDDDLQTKKRVDDGDWRGRNRESSQRPRERDDILMRKKDEDHSRRERSEKEDSLHGYRAREDSSRRKRVRDDVSDHRRREDSTRTRDKAEDHHSIKHKDESWYQREREDRQRLKQPHEDSMTHREREEGRGASRSGRTVEDKPLVGHDRNKDESKGMGSDKDYHQKDRRRQNEQSKRVGRAGEEKQFNNEERSSRHERLSNTDRPSSASDSHHREKHRESTRKGKDTEVSGQNPQGSGKRKNEDHSSHRNEKISLKGTNELGSNNTSSTTLAKKCHHQLPHSSGANGEEDPASDDENQDESRRGRSKLERWTSHKERDYSIADNKQSSSSKTKEVEGTNTNIVPAEELSKIEGNEASNQDPKGADAGQDDRDRHLDTVAKLKRRSERFKLPLPGEKDTAVNKKVESELQSTQNEVAADSDVKPERPARKRRWTSS